MTTEIGPLPAETQIAAGHRHPRLRTHTAEATGSIPVAPTRVSPQVRGRFAARHLSRSLEDFARIPDVPAPNLRHQPADPPRPQAPSARKRLRPSAWRW